MVLEHSQFVKSVDCAADGLLVTFTDITAYNFAKNSWSSTTDFVLVTYTNGCGSSSDQRTFWLIDHLNFLDGQNAVDCVAQKELAIEDAIFGVDMVWGTYRPDNTTVNFNAPSGGPPYGNSTTSSGGNSTGCSCGEAPSAQIDGFPTATCGSPDFDKVLDDEIGYLNFDSADYSTSLKAFAPGIEDTKVADNQGLTPTGLKRRSYLHRRDWFTDNIVKPVGNAVNDIGQGVKKIGEDIGKGVQVAGKLASDALAVNPEINADIPIDIKGPKLVPSPWGDAIELFKKDKSSDSGTVTGEIALYCVKCGVNGKVHLGGSARWTIAEGLTKANAEMKGNIEAGLQLGLDAKAAYKQTFPFPIAQAGVPGFSVSGLITIGPVIKLDAEVELGVEIEGQVLAGVIMKIPNFQANLDLVDGTKSKSEGFEPEWEKIFEAKGKITATAGIGLPLSIGLGIVIPPLKLDKTASIVDKPSINAKMTYTASTTGGTGDSSAKCNNGVGWSIDFKNDLYADIFGVKKFDLHKFEKSIADGCIPVGGDPSPSSSVSDSAFSTTSAATDTAVSASELTATTAPSSADASTTPSTTAEAATSAPDAPTSAPAPDAPTAAPSKRSLTFPCLHPRQTADPFAFVDNSDEQARADSAEFEQLSSAALDEAKAYSQNTSLTNSDGPNTSYVNLHDLDSTYSLQASTDGNLYLVSPASPSKFASDSTFLLGDDNDRYFHYHPNVMTKYGVSRLRLSGADAIPKDADFVALVPVDYDNNPGTPSVYAAIDTQGGIFFTMVVNISGQPSKVFLANDPVEGCKALENEKLRFTVTGGVVEDCWYLPWAVPAAN